MSAAYFYQGDSKNTLTRTISVTSGKGGVGKTTLLVNLALHLGRRGHKVLLLDGDLGMGNVDIMFGRTPTDALKHVLSGDASLTEVISQVAPNVFLIPGGNGVYDLARTNSIQKRVLIDQVNQLESIYDYMLIDTAPGIDDNVLFLNAAASEIMVVVTPDPASMADAYALIKVLNQRHKENRFSIVCNMVRDESEAMRVFQRLSDVAQRFLCVGLDYKGFVPSDPVLRRATKSQQLVLEADPRSPSAVSIRNLAENLSGSRQIAGIKGGMQFFWEQMVGVA